MKVERSIGFTAEYPHRRARGAPGGGEPGAFAELLEATLALLPPIQGIPRYAPVPVAPRDQPPAPLASASLVRTAAVRDSVVLRLPTCGNGAAHLVVSSRAGALWVALALPGTGAPRVAQVSRDVDTRLRRVGARVAGVCVRSVAGVPQGGVTT